MDERVAQCSTRLFLAHRAILITTTSRVPALQFLLLFGSLIDTNSTVDRVVVDSWLELAFSSPDDGQQVLSAVVALRFRITKNSDESTGALQ